MIYSIDFSQRPGTIRAKHLHEKFPAATRRGRHQDQAGGQGGLGSQHGSRRRLGEENRNGAKTTRDSERVCQHRPGPEEVLPVDEHSPHSSQKRRNVTQHLHELPCDEGRNGGQDPGGDLQDRGGDNGLSVAPEGHGQSGAGGALRRSSQSERGGVQLRMSSWE